MTNRKTLLLLIYVLTAVLILLVGIVLFLSRRDNKDPDDFSSQNSTVDTPDETTKPTVSDPSTPSQPTEPTVTNPPTDPPTEPTDPNRGEMIGSLYTRQELEALDNEGRGYGPGRFTNGKRPDYAVWDQQSYGKYAGNFIAPDNGKIYLTFDCGYEYTATDENGNKYRVTERILDVLKEKNVKAVFFVTMPYVKEQPDLVRRMINEGHAVGNHSNNHPVMPNCTIDEMVYEVMSLHDYVKENFGYEMTLFRFPTGEYSERSMAVVQSLGYKSVHWSFAYLDYNTANQPSIADGYEEVTKRHHSGAIYLLHAVSTTNAAILGDCIDFFVAQGYELDLFQ